MLAVLCARSHYKFHLSHFHSSTLHHRPFQSPIHFPDHSNRLRQHSTACRLSGTCGAASSIWHVIQPRRKRRRTCAISLRPLPEPRGEGSWNVAWDARPARWLHRPDSSWLLFGVCACLSPIVAVDDDKDGVDCFDDKSDSDYKVTGVAADGRCLFRAIAHGACLRNGEEAPDENRQTELADELRAQVVCELLKRRKEIEWFIEGDFDEYIKRIQQPYVWGGEPELLMACHVLKTMISVFMVDRKSSNLVNIANYGEEYKKEEVNPINVQPWVRPLRYSGDGRPVSPETEPVELECGLLACPAYTNSK